MLAALVTVAAVARFWLSLDMATPWIFADEFIYSELARSLAERGELIVRDQSIYYSTLVPLLHAPGYLLGDTATAYVWIKGANAVVMSAAAVPAYLLARLALRPLLSLVFAVLVLAWPAFAYTGTIMTEPLFFLGVMTVAWALARALLRPTWGAQIVVGAALLGTLLVRLQGVSLVATVPIACLLAAVMWRAEGSGIRGVLGRLRAYWPMLAMTLGLPLLVLAGQAARGRPVRDLLGGYSQVEVHVGMGELVDWTVWHLAVAGLAVGLVPLALAVAAWVRALSRRWDDDSAAPAAVVLTVLAISAPMLVQVTVFAIQYSMRVQERNLFGMEPLIVLAALVGLAAMRINAIVAIAASVAVALAVLDLPVDALIAPTPPLSDTFTLLSVLEGSRTLGSDPATVVTWAAFAGIGLTAIIALVRHRHRAVALAGLLLAALVAMNAQITPLLTDYSERVAAAFVPADDDWVDDALPGGARAMFAWGSEDPPTVAWTTEFWNRSIGPVIAVPGQFATLAVPQASVDAQTGRLVPVPGSTIPRAEYVVAPRRWDLAGEKLAQGDAPGAPMTLWRVHGPLRLAATTDGLYADGWTGPQVVARRFDCRPGTFAIHLRSAAGRNRRVAITTGGREVRIVLPRHAARTIRVATRPEPGGDVCQLTVTPLTTATGAELGNPADPRTLGVRMETPAYTPG